MTEQGLSGKRVLRRDLLRSIGAGALVSMSAPGCQLLSTDPAGDGDVASRQGPRGRKPKQAPVLAARVEAGELAPLRDRLPTVPLVVEVVDRTGVYGGVWRTAISGPADTAWLERTIGYDHLMVWDREFTKPVPNVAESVEITGGGRGFVFHLRPGMKWSDGEPFAANDIAFAYNDVMRNEELYPVLPGWLSAAGSPATVSVVDEATIEFTFDEPNGLFLMSIAAPGGAVLTTCPKHYLQQFHPDYASGLTELAEDEGYSSWAELFWERADRWGNADIPTLDAWKVTAPVGAQTRVTAERNAYYWKTDPDGSQLPYIDEVVYEVVADDQAMLLNASNGDLDMHARHFNTPENKPVLARGRQSGGYKFFDLSSPPNDMSVHFNLTHEDESLRQVFRNKDFRIGLSHAIDRQEIIDVVYQGQGELWQLAPPRESPLFDEEMGRQYTEYDVDRANQHLDRAGFGERDGDGYRIGVDGQRISFQVDVPVGYNPNFEPALSLIVDYWDAVGVEMRMNSVDRSLYTERSAANAHDVDVWGGGGDQSSTAASIMEPYYYFPFNSGSRFAVRWASWYESGEGPVEPPSAARRQMELYDRIRSVVDPDEQEALFREILQIAKEEFYVMGIVALPPGTLYGLVKNNFHNVPGSMIAAYTWPTPGGSRPEQYFVAG